MYTSRGKRRVIIAIVVIVSIIAFLGVLTYAYLTTDLFKSNQDLFFKYLGKTAESFKYVENMQISQMQTLKQEMPYNMTATLDCQTDNESADNTSDILSNLKLNITSNVNMPEQKLYAKANLNFKEQNLFTLEYANSNNIYALKSSEVATAYLGIRNENIKGLAQKLGLEDVSMVPDTIAPIDLNTILEISEEEKTHIKETYMKVLLNSINKENYKKEQNLPINKEGINYIVDAYRLDLTSEELKNLEISILETLKQDSITLNLITTKAKLLGLDENYTQVNNLSNLVQEKIKEINTQTIVSDAGISIIIYIDNGQVLLTEIILKNEVKYTIYSDTIDNMNKKYILFEDLSATAEYSKIEIALSETINDAQTIYDLTINLNNETNIETYITNSYSVNLDSYNTNCEITIDKTDSNSLIINYGQNIKFSKNLGSDIISLDKTNCAILNDYTTEQIQSLTESLIGRIGYLFTEKIQLLTSSINNNVVPENITQTID